MSYGTSLNLQRYKLEVLKSTNIDFVKKTCVHCIDELIKINETLPDPDEMTNNFSKLRLIHEQSNLKISILEEKLADRKKISQRQISWQLILIVILFIVPTSVYGMFSIGEAIAKMESTK
jgi:hypothetical protein